MRNVWKGFVIGALTGAGIGLALDWNQQPGSGAEGTQEAEQVSIRGRLSPDNVWKGFLVGAISGAGIGLALELGERVGRDVAVTAARAGQTVRERAPEVAQRVAESDAAHALADAAQHTAKGASRAGKALGELTEDATQAAKKQLADL